MWSVCKSYLFLIILSVLSSCQPAAEATEAEANIDGGGAIADIIRNPVSVDNTVDTNLVAAFTFEEDIHNFGEIDQGGIAKHTFKFVNTGKVPLIISDVRSTCGCTVADYPKEAIAPGASGEIPVTFDTKKKSGRQSKPITITANTYPGKSVLYLEGVVRVQNDS